jgi:DHA1 family tetracycline resistance protein-like MFS transporter
MRKPSLLIIFLSVFIDLIGFGIVLPLLPRYVERFGGKGFVIGMVISSFSIMQFLFAPAWGRLSDRIGRRPVLLISNAGSAASYALFAVAASVTGTGGLLILLASRVFAGICGANLSVASAYIADITPPEKRSKSMGLIGMAFGLGFILGPALGGFAGKYGLACPGWIASALCAGNFLLGCFILAESRQPSSEHAPIRPRLKQWTHTLSHPKLGVLIGLYFLATLCFTCFESTLPLLLDKNVHYNETRVGYLFAYCGLVAALTQGGLIGWLIKKFGDQRLISLSLFAVAVSLAMLPFMFHLFGLLIALGLFAASSNINRAPTMGQISLNSAANEQGATMGVAQSAATLARCVGPPLATTLYFVRTPLPYLTAAGIAIIAAILGWQYLHKGQQIFSAVEVQKIS